MERITAQEVDCILRQYLYRRPDLGLRNAAADKILEPANPFESRSRRRPQRWFVLFGMSAFFGVAAFAYFNLWT